MATGIIGSIGSAASLSYTPNVDAKVLISTGSTGAGTVTVNGSVVISLSAAGSGNQTIFVGAGQTITVANSTGCSSIVSALEGS